MKKVLVVFWSIFILFPLAYSPAAAEVVLSQLRWQALPSKQSGGGPPQDISSLSRAPDARGGPILGAEAVLRNNGLKVAVGVLIRYSVEAKIASVGKVPAQAGTWTVPFWWEQAHIPEISAGTEKRFPIRDLNLETYLKRLSSEGFWPTALRIRVMIEPRRGDDLSELIAEAELPIDWGGASK